MIKIFNYGQVSDEEIFARDNIAPDVEGVVAEIIANVIKNGDDALREYAAKFDKVQLTSLEVTQQEIDEAFATVEPEAAVLRILEVQRADGRLSPVTRGKAGMAEFRRNRRSRWFRSESRQRLNLNFYGRQLQILIARLWRNLPPRHPLKGKGG